MHPPFNQEATSGPQLSPGTFSVVRDSSGFGRSRGAAAGSPPVPLHPPEWTLGQSLPNGVHFLEV